MTFPHGHVSLLFDQGHHSHCGFRAMSWSLVGSAVGTRVDNDFLSAGNEQPVQFSSNEDGL